MDAFGFVGVDGFERRSRSGNTFENKYLFIPATALLILTSSIHAMNGESVRQQADFFVGWGRKLVF